MKCLFLGYDKKKTRLITLLERKGIEPAAASLLIEESEK